MGIALKIRQFFEELLGSRLADEIKEHLLFTRADFERRLQDKDNILVDYKTELDLARAKIAQYELVLIPLSSAAGAQMGNIFNPKPKSTFDLLDSATSISSWQSEQEKWYKEQQIEAEAENASKSNTEVL